MAMFVFTSLMLPMQEDRRIVEKCTQTLVDNVGILDSSAFFNEPAYDHFKKNLIHHTQNKWTNMEEAYKYLKDQPLFKRIHRNQVPSYEFQDLIELMQPEFKKKGQIIFIEPKYIHIVLNGRVVLRYHEEDPLQYQHIA